MFILFYELSVCISVCACSYTCVHFDLESSYLKEPFLSFQHIQESAPPSGRLRRSHSEMDMLNHVVMTMKGLRLSVGGRFQRQTSVPCDRGGCEESVKLLPPPPLLPFCFLGDRFTVRSRFNQVVIQSVKYIEILYYESKSVACHTFP